MTTTLLHSADMHADERVWLVKYCTRLCGDRTLADDLAQETLLAAWQGAQRMPVGVERRAWLAGIARNMVRRWARQRHQERQHVIPLADDDDLALTSASMDYDLDRHELAALLDRTLALLPPPTRAALIAHYIDEQPQAEIARCLGLSEGAVAVRLHRGRLTLARLLARESPEAVRAVGIAVPTPTGWETTHLWCFLCGKRHLEGWFNATHTVVRLRCPACGEMLHHGVAINGAKTFGAALNRITRWAAAYYLPGADSGTLTCLMCGQACPAQVEIVHEVGIQVPILVGNCACTTDTLNTCDVLFMALLTPAGQSFTRAQGRIRFAGLDYVETARGATGVLTFTSVTSADRFVATFDQRTLHMLP